MRPHHRAVEQVSLILSLWLDKRSIGNLYSPMFSPNCDSSYRFDLNRKSPTALMQKLLDKGCQKTATIVHRTEM